MRAGLPFSLLNKKVDKTTAVLHLFADGTLGNNNNSGLPLSIGTGGSFSYAGGVVTFTGTGASWNTDVIGKLVTIDYATSPGNNISAIITGRPASNQITYANARGVTEVFPATGYWAVSSPKKDLQPIFDLAPTGINHSTSIHLSGIFSEQPDSYLDRNVKENVKFVIDGGTATTIIADNAGSPWAADISSVSSIGLTTLGWAPNTYAKYWVEVLSGPAIGQTRLITEHTATTITPVRNFSVDPGAGAQFRIVRPTTQISSSTASSIVLIKNSGFGTLYMQGFYTLGTKPYIFCYKSIGTCFISSCILAATPSYSAQVSFGIGSFIYYKFNPWTFVSESASANLIAGMSSLTANTSIDRSWSTSIVGCCLKDLYIFNSQLSISSGTRLASMKVYGGSPSLYSTTIGNSSGFAVTKIGGITGHGLTLNTTAVSITTGVTFADIISGHGIVCNNSMLQLSGGVIGSNITGAGVHAHFNSKVAIVGSINYGQGTGDSFTAALGIVTLEDAAGLFTTAMIGNTVCIAGSTTPANNGTFIILSRPSTTQITYANAAGVTEAFAGTWKIGVPKLTGTIGDLSTDGVTQKSTWAAIDAGTPAIEANELTMAKVI